MNKLIFIFFLSFSFLSCSKNQTGTNKLDGSWNIIKAESNENGITEELIALGGSGTIIYDDCKLNENDYCNVTETFTYPDGNTYTEVKYYRVINDGENLEYYNPLNTVNPTIILTIVELTKKKCKLTYVVDEITQVMELEKI